MGSTLTDVRIAKINAVAQIVAAALAKGVPETKDIRAYIAAVIAGIQSA